MSTEIALRNEAVPALVEEPAVLASRAPNPAAAIEFASQCASLLKGVLVKQRLITRIQGKDHVNAEGWTLLAAMTGYSPRVAWSRKVDPEIGDGWEACVELLDAFGRVCSAAEAMALVEEDAKWARQEYSVRSMAQTRATSRAIRLKLGYIVTMAGYSATAAEEMPSDVHPSATPGLAAPARGRHAGGAPVNQQPASSATSPGAPPVAGTQGAVVDPRPATTAPSPSSAEHPQHKLHPLWQAFQSYAIPWNATNRDHAIDALKVMGIEGSAALWAREREMHEVVRDAFNVKPRAEVVVPVPSKSRPGEHHDVTLRRYGDEADAVCPCEAFKFHGVCDHLQGAWLQLGLSWLSEEPLSPEQAWDGIDVQAQANVAQASYAEAFPDAAAKRKPKMSAKDNAVADAAFGDEPAPTGAAA